MVGSGGLCYTDFRMGIPDAELEKLLRENQYLSENDLQAAKETANRESIPLSQAVVREDLISDENLGKVIADYYQIPFVDLSKSVIPDNILHIIPEAVARAQHAVAFALDEYGLKLATSNPANKEFINYIAQKIEGNVTIYFASDHDIEDTLSLYRKELQKTFDELLRKQVPGNIAGAVANTSVTRILDLIIEYAYQDKASDIHIEPYDDYSLVRFRIDGILHDIVSLPKAFHEQIISRIKVLAKLRTDEHLSAQDGKMQKKFPEEDLDIRVSIIPIVHGEKAVLRLLSSRSRQFSFRNLGISDQDLEKIRRAYQKPYGMLLSTGPTGSGKTTTIYAIIKVLNTRDKNIATIEDPVEYEIRGINQIQVNAKTNLTFSEGLRAILRQDPNVIFVGEIRDSDTAAMAVNSAMTGHLVLSTLHTNDAATALPRLIDMGIEPFLISSTVNVVIAQRLVRKICEKCRVSMTLDANKISRLIPRKLVQKYFGADQEIRVYRGKGCAVCRQTGYTGRVGLFEVLEMSHQIQELVNRKADSNAIFNQALQEGMGTMLEDGLGKVQKGLTTIEEVLRAIKE